MLLLKKAGLSSSSTIVPLSFPRALKGKDQLKCCRACIAFTCYPSQKELNLPLYSGLMIPLPSQVEAEVLDKSLRPVAGPSWKAMEGGAKGCVPQYSILGRVKIRQ